MSLILLIIIRQLLLYQIFISVCEKPVSINNGNVEYGGTVMGSVATYTCHEDYELQGMNESKCLHNERWDGKVPVCIPGKK